MVSPPRFNRARAMLAYDDASPPIISAYTRASRIEGTPLLTRCLLAAGRDLIADADLVAPTPLHWRRLLERRYNQFAELARRVAGSETIPCAPDLLHRTRATRSQARLSPAGRKRNLTGAFKLNERWRDRITGKRILLIDDVFTTGATVERCSAVLKRGGASAVDVVTIARVERPRPV
jgi:ComF family protein